MSNQAVSGDYLPAGEIDVVSEGREAWERIRVGVKMLREDWLVVGRALAVGREENKSNQAFGQWCDANGFGAIGNRVRSDALWCLENQGVFQQLENGIEHNHPVAIRSAYRKQARDSEPKAIAPQKIKQKLPKQNIGRILSAIKDLSDCVQTPEQVYRNSTDKQRAQIEQDIKHAYTFVTQLYQEVTQ